MTPCYIIWEFILVIIPMDFELPIIEMM